MKELSIEEKAKAYDKALKVAKDIRNGEAAYIPDGTPVIDAIFPELKESDDEEIRKEIISIIKSYRESCITEGNHRFDDCIAWLEKQGEKKPEVKYVYTKFRIGDVIVEIKPNGYCPPVTVKYVGEGSYSCESDDGKRFLSFPIIRQDEYKLVKQVSVWSEEDESHIRYLIECLEHCKKGVALTMTTSTSQEYIDWLKSLSPQHTWKPSEEQMKAIEFMVRSFGESGTLSPYGETMAYATSLLNDLKKL